MMDEKREKPVGADDYGWNEFEVWAFENGITENTDDWMPWWECWKTGYYMGQA